MSRRTITLALAALLVLGLTGGTTSTYMTASATNAGNVFQVGSVDLSLEPTSAAFDVPALAPGQEVSAVLGVKNQGSLPYTFTVAARKTAGYASVFETLTCTCTTVDDNVEVYAGSLAGLASAPHPVPPGSAQDVRVKVGLPAGAGDDVGGKYSKVSFDVLAEQRH